MKFPYAVHNIMTSDLITVVEDQPIEAAIKVMVAKEIGSVVVITDDGQFAGILTERDIIKHLSRSSLATAVAIKNIMSRPLITIDSEEALGHAADVMTANRIRRLLVTKDDQIVGIVTERDLMRATLDVFKKLSDAWV